MTPKEKAKYLYEKFRCIEMQMHSPAGFFMGFTYLSKETAHTCCQVFVDEKLVETQGAKYWQDVKKELELL